VEIEPFPNLKRWVDAIAARPAAQRGISVPVPQRVLTEADQKEFVEHARKIVTSGKPD
jgi:hypothetical protein